MDTNPPRNVIYNNDPSSSAMQQIAGLPYTDVILNFLTPDGNGGLTGPMPDQGDVQAVQNAGKNVLISLGGSTFPSASWQQYAQDPNGVSNLVGQVVPFVTGPGLNGVDIDFEDDNGFGPSQAYDGVTFLADLTNQLAAALPGCIITHAPQPPYFDSNGGYNSPGSSTAPYTQIWQQAGGNISWFNCQFYNNPQYDGSVSTDAAGTKVYWYNTFVETTGVPPQKLLVGAPVAANAAQTGYLSVGDFTSVIAPLRQLFPGAFGGVMGWDFADDQNGAWATGIWQALTNGQPTPPPPGPPPFFPLLFVAHQGQADDGQLWYDAFDGQNWAGDKPVPNTYMSENPSAVVFNGVLYFFHQGQQEDGQLWYTTTSDGQNWTGDQQVPGTGMSASPSAMVYNGVLYVFHQGQGDSGELWYTTSTDGQNWTADQQVPGTGMSENPSAVVFNNALYVFHQGQAENGQLWYNTTSDGQNWTGDQQMPNTYTSASPSAIVTSFSATMTNGVLYCFHQGQENTGQLWYNTTSDGQNWAGDQQVPSTYLSASPSVCGTAPGLL